MKKTLHPFNNLPEEDYRKLVANPQELANHIKKIAEYIIDEHDRQLGSPQKREEIIASSGFDHNPIPRERNGLVFRGNRQSLSVFYSESTLHGQPSVFDVKSESDFETMFGKDVPDQLIRVFPRRLTDAIFLIVGLVNSPYKIIVLTGSLQQTLPLLFQQNNKPVERNSVNSILYDIRKGFAPPEKRRRELQASIKKIEQANEK